MLNIEDVNRYIQLARAGVKVENPKVELKRQWWNFEEQSGQEEFIKDVTAMANTLGDSGYFIIGLDEDTGELFDMPFPTQSRYDDPTKLGQLVSRKIQEPFNIECYPFTIESKIIYVLEIPRSFNKPHLIKQHRNIQNFIPIRKSTGTYSADKFDLDLMYSERNQIVIPPYRLDFHVVNPSKLFESGLTRGKATISLIMNILNTGTNINMVVGGQLSLLNGDNQLQTLNHNAFYIPGISEEWSVVEDNVYIKIKPNDIIRVNIGFCFEDNLMPYEIRDLLKTGNLKGIIMLEDISGKTVYSDKIDFLPV